MLGESVLFADSHSRACHSKFNASEKDPRDIAAFAASLGNVRYIHLLPTTLGGKQVSHDGELNIK